MRVSIFKYREYVAGGARSIVLKNFFICLIRYICFAPFMLLIIILFSIVAIFIFILAKVTITDLTFKDCLKTFNITEIALDFFSKDSLELIFCNYYCHFKCKICKKKCYYSANKIDNHTNLPLWGWLDDMPNTCYGCYKKRNKL